MRPRKHQIGDMVLIREDATVLKLHRHPMDVMKYLEDMGNPKLILQDGKNVLPEDFEMLTIKTEKK